MEKITINHIQKSFDHTVALDQVSLTVEAGSFFTFLGPSGCGKTTLLRIIAGFLKAEEGEIFVGDRDITHLPAENRGIGMVFQNYALFPHLNVYDNVAYGLKIKKISPQEIKKQVMDYLKLVRLESYAARKVSELSGGEQQRVALARSLVTQPKVLLLDEPLCNLDAKLRDEMREEIKRIQRQLGVTTIFVTHDQKEALTLSDQIAVFHKGRCMQVGTPKEIYNNPKNAFVASFVGETNLLNARACEQLGILHEMKGRENLISIRPEQIKLYPLEIMPDSQLKGTIEKVEFNGNMSEYCVKTKDIVLKVMEMSSYDPVREYGVGDEVWIEIPLQAMKRVGE